ncbi:FecR family protein [Dokdonia sp.]|uniref:FecR family protein n=1 Tax=Dokdonia sp. TaxID=2024995 RepID=UPI0032653434
MKREELIKKWLDNELDSKELELFKNLDDYEDLLRISNSMRYFKADSYDTHVEFEKIEKIIEVKQKRNWFKPLSSIAAVLLVIFGVYYSFSIQETEVSTLASQKQTLELPDHSSVSLNALSSLTYDADEWDINREVELKGEAFFKVEKGATFHVKTASGLVTVVGTEFIVKDREELFEVICYEGSVRVNHNGSSILLKEGDRYTYINGTSGQTKTTQENPSWINNTSTFKSMPYSVVIAEFERQYGIAIHLEEIDAKQLYTGSFIHDNMDIALKSITLPLNLKFSRTNRMITLKSE